MRVQKLYLESQFFVGNGGVGHHKRKFWGNELWRHCKSLCNEARPQALLRTFPVNDACNDFGEGCNVEDSSAWTLQFEDRLGNRGARMCPRHLTATACSCAACYLLLLPSIDDQARFHTDPDENTLDVALQWPGQGFIETAMTRPSTRCSA